VAGPERRYDRLTEPTEDPTASSVFTDKTAEPSESRLARALGATAPIWAELRGYLEEEYGTLADEWKFYSTKSGWVRKTLLKERNLFFFTPLDGYFRLGFVFGDRRSRRRRRAVSPKRSRRSSEAHGSTPRAAGLSST
jgi:hypothetical protein